MLAGFWSGAKATVSFPACKDGREELPTIPKPPFNPFFFAGPFFGRTNAAVVDAVPEAYRRDPRSPWGSDPKLMVCKELFMLPFGVARNPQSIRKIAMSSPRISYEISLHVACERIGGLTIIEQAHDSITHYFFGGGERGRAGYGRANL
jgi:hypothetical protein